LRGKPLADVAQLDWSASTTPFNTMPIFCVRLYWTWLNVPQAMGTTQLVISGLSEVLRQPEFSESQQVQAIIRFCWKKNSPNYGPYF
jgi:heat-inducible transcriptional repressor